MPDDYLRSIEPLIGIVLDWMRWKSARFIKRDREEEDDRRAATIISKRRLQCPTSPMILELAEPCDAQFVMASWSRPALFVANRPLFQEVCRLLRSSPGKCLHLAVLVPTRLGPGAREPREGSMTFHISQRGREYLKTAQTLLRAAQTMIDRAVAGQLKALADDYQPRAEKAHVHAAKAFARSAVNAAGE